MYKNILLLLFLGSQTLFAKNENLLQANRWSTFARQHVFMVDKNGWCIDPCWKWNLGDGTNRINIYRGSLDKIRDGIRSWCQTNDSPSKRIIVFVHGGMNPYGNSFITMTNLSPLMMSDNCYPIFVVWDSGPFDSYADHLFRIRQGEEHRWISICTSPLVFISDLAVGVARFPQTYSGRVYNDINTAELPRNATNFFNAYAAARWEGFESLIASNLPNTYHPPQEELNKRTWTERNVRFTEYILTIPTKIATLPLLDGMGTEAWDIMLRRTRTMFEMPSTYEVADKLSNWKTENPDNVETNNFRVKKWLSGFETNPIETDVSPKKGAMILFSKAMAQWSANPSAFFQATNLDFEFYGHSMGTIVLNEMFENMPNIKAKRIVYLAAACSIEDFEGAIFPYLWQNTNAQFYSVSLHRMCEREEYSLYSVAGVKHIPVLRDLIVRGSLLNWIDDIFAKPNAITDRTLGAWENITRALPDIPDAIRKQTHFRGCDIEQVPIMFNLGGKYEPQIHANFTKAQFWNTNFFWPVGTNQLLLIKH
jgi:hypothetical protein